jgi:2,4-dienoyl-CoA reductase-like NADH-dependent reductase (Old Yellow Enzyme family)/thioredoxin reductase
MRLPWQRRGLEKTKKETMPMLLEQPGLIGGLRLKNRVVMAPMGTNYSTTDGLSTERDKQYYEERARGGVGMIMTEAMVVTEQARPHNNSLCCYHDRFIPGLASIVDAIKRHDCHVFGQLNHRGALLRRSVLNMEPVGPSPWANPNTGDVVRPLAVSEIVDIQKLFVAAARRLWLAGYDGVEIHAGNGYLFQQFFSPRINHRDDAYGGSLQNRMRLLLETIDRMRDALPDLRLVIRLSASEFAEGGYSAEDIVALAQAVEHAGADAIDLSGGSNESPQLSKFCIQPPSFARGCLADVARPIKQAVGIPVFVAGRIVEPVDAERVLASGSADFISVGRALYADPHWCLKAFGKLDAPIRQCIACNVCFERLTLEKDVACVQNPMIGTEFENLEHAEPQLYAPPAGPRQRVLVLGAGVAGMEAARVLKGRGHDVEVWEKQDRPGGQMPLATASPDKTEVEPVWTYRWDAVQRMGVKVRMAVDADAARIRSFAPDYVVVATGARPAPPPMDVTKLDAGIRVLHAWDVLAALDQVKPGLRVTIVGGGMVGAETADALRVRGAAITILEMQATIANGMARNNKFELIERLADAGVRILTQCRIVGAAGLHLDVQLNGGEPSRIEVGDMLVFATGPRPNAGVVAAVEATGIPYARIGDCNAPGDFLAALRDAWMVALSVDERSRRSAEISTVAGAPIAAAMS